jgi:hypothetical protein
MLHHSNGAPRSPLTLEDGLTLWRARDIYRARRFVRSLVITVLLLETLAYASMGDGAGMLTVVPLHALGLWGLAWMLRRAATWIRAGWHWLAMLLLLSLAVSGCQDMTRGVAHLYGYKGDIYANPCTPESLYVGHCVTTKQGAKP